MLACVRYLAIGATSIAITHQIVSSVLALHYIT